MASSVHVVTLSPPPTMVDKFMPRQWATWFNQVFNRLGAGPFKIPAYKVSIVTGVAAVQTLKAADWGSVDLTKDPYSSIIFVPDAFGGGCLCYSDGTLWRRISDNLPVT